MITNQIPIRIATRCLDAAANLDDDEIASPTELAAIASTIALALYPRRADTLIACIAQLTMTDIDDIRSLMR